MPHAGRGSQSLIRPSRLATALREGKRATWTYVGDATGAENQAVATREPEGWAVVSISVEARNELVIYSGVALDVLAYMKPDPRAAPEVVPLISQLNDREMNFVRVRDGDLTIEQVPEFAHLTSMPASTGPLEVYIEQLTTTLPALVSEVRVFKRRMASIAAVDIPTLDLHTLKQTLFMAGRVGSASDIQLVQTAIRESEQAIVRLMADSEDPMMCQGLLSDSLVVPVRDEANPAAVAAKRTGKHNPATQRMLAFVQTAEGLEMMQEFLAEIGGDPHEYGFEDAATATDRQLAEGLRLFLGIVSSGNLPTPEMARLVQSEPIDWLPILEAGRRRTLM